MKAAAPSARALCLLIYSQSVHMLHTIMSFTVSIFVFELLKPESHNGTALHTSSEFGETDVEFWKTKCMILKLQAIRKPL
jgi:hypothetical protein